MENEWTIATIWERLSGKKAPEIRDTHVEYTNKNGKHVEYERESGRKKETEETPKYSSVDDIKSHFKNQKINLKNLADETIHKLSNEEVKTIREYTGNEYKQINKALRYGENNNSRKKGEIIKNAILKSRTPEAITVHRLCDNDYIKHTFGTLNINELKGRRGNDKGIVSASITENPRGITGKNSIYYSLPKGAHAVYAEPATQHKRQYEVILLYTEKSKIIDVKQKKDGGLEIYVEH